MCCQANGLQAIVLTMSMTGPDLYSHVTVNDTDRTGLHLLASRAYHILGDSAMT